MARILLTGAAGYIGSHTWLALQAAGLRVIGLDDFSNSSPEVLERLTRLFQNILEMARIDARAIAAEQRWVHADEIIEVKEVKFRPGTDEGDYLIKMRNLRRFIAEDRDKGKVTLRFRGREITHQEIGMRLLERIRDELADVSVVENMPKLEGRQMIMVLAPKRK